MDPTLRKLALVLSVFVIAFSRLCHLSYRAFLQTEPRESGVEIQTLDDDHGNGHQKLNATTNRRRRLQEEENHEEEMPSDTTKERVLYMVTSIAEFDTGRRQTVEGNDRFTNTLIPVLEEGVHSMVKAGFSVDVYLITAYNVTISRRRQVEAVLPDTVGLEIWDDATPIGYEMENSLEHVSLHTRGLARQHRYVIKDKFFHYDLFCAFEDDMLLRAEHLEHYVHMTNALYGLRLKAKRQHPVPVTVEQAATVYFGPMTQQQLARTIPGFIRVEAVLPGYNKPVNKRMRFDQIPVNYQWQDDGKNSSIDPSICCHISQKSSANGIAHLPKSPPGVDDLVYWETSIDALGVRRMPIDASEINNLGWVLLLGGNNNEIWEDASYVIGDYWSGRGEQQYFISKPRPDRKKGRYVNNQGGWMATRRQVTEWHNRWCRGGFLPPYDLPHYQFDGLDLRSVEYWSGGIQLVGVNSCNLQRIVMLDPKEFSKHLLYHTSNNKQRAPKVRHQFSGRSINEFWGQLNTIKKNAEASLKILASQPKG